MTYGSESECAIHYTTAPSYSKKFAHVDIEYIIIIIIIIII